MVAGIIFGGALAIISFVLCGSYLKTNNSNRALTSFLLGVFFISMTMAAVIKTAKDGSPATEISPGIYKIGFVYQAGDNVNLGVEKQYDKAEDLHLYRFPAKDFEGGVKIGAKKLVAYKLITGDGTFDKYRLE